ncbi:hypothetical protein TELCIR_08791 [Teladorsagia circumcincta]|uniref:Uncharacterized protein n=1 Tax=Teladorsagia circumcincta TaxID=45464 RepID=A0A2G9UGK6_TELCI|nr:hypothetical protein TELCIR_08791 [Teladorsagia circumcincta]
MTARTAGQARPRSSRIRLAAQREAVVLPWHEAIADEVARSGQSIDKVRADAEATMKMMAHNWGLFSTRTFGYAVTKVLERIFDSIYVNAGQLKKIRELCKTDAEVPLPAIAAGMDFTNSWFMSEVLRRCGAFYIKRSIGQRLGGPSGHGGAKARMYGAHAG